MVLWWGKKVGQVVADNEHTYNYHKLNFLSFESVRYEMSLKIVSLGNPPGVWGCSIGIAGFDALAKVKTGSLSMGARKIKPEK